LDSGAVAFVLYALVFVSVSNLLQMSVTEVKKKQIMKLFKYVTICGLFKKYSTFGREKYLYMPGGLQT
jgi:hypothetical protein